MIRIPLYDDKYAVTKQGLVYSFKSNKFLKLINHSAGYKVVMLTKNGKQKKHYVHRLVCSAYLGLSKLQVNHKDGIKTNNNLDNLEYCTTQQNTKHAQINNLIKSGEKCIKSKLKKYQVNEIRRRYAQGNISIRKLAKNFNCGSQTIYDIVKYKTWRK